MTRSDVHSPKNLVTEDYEYVFAYDSGNAMVLTNLLSTDEGQKFWEELQANMVRIHDANCQCDHCGAWIRYVAILRHKPTGKYITVGETCLENRFERATSDFHAMRKAAELDRQQQRIRQACEAYKTEHSDVDWEALAASENWFVQDVMSKFRRYGEMSDRQLDAIVRAVARDAERAAEKANQPEEVFVQPEPAKAVRITGTVMTTKYVEGYVGGSVLKMMVKVERAEGNWKLWGTVPDSIQYNEGHGVEKGSTVTFTADVKPASWMADGGEFVRPRKAEIVRPASE